MAEAQPRARRPARFAGPAADAARAELRGDGAAGPGPADPARRRDRGAAARHVAAADRGGRPAAGERPDRDHRRPRRSTPSSPAARSSTSIPACSPAAENANEVQGVIAHELGHIAGGHVLRQQQGVQQATGIMILSLLLGAAAIAAGGGEAGMAAIMAGQQAAMGRFLAFTRDQENSADQAGATFLARAGISGRGSLAFFRRLQNLEYRMIAPDQDEPLRPDPPAQRRAHRRARGALPGRSRLGPPHRSGARGRASSGSAPSFRAMSTTPARCCSAIRPATIRSRPIMPAPMPITAPAHPEEANAEVDALLAGAAARSLFPRAEGPGPARRRPSAARR